MEYTKGYTVCCNAEAYDDNEFCSECYAKDPETHQASLNVTEPFPGHFYCVDSDYYDGAPDSADLNSIIGFGSMEAEAIEDFWEKAEEYPEYQ